MLRQPLHRPPVCGRVCDPDRGFVVRGVMPSLIEKLRARPKHERDAWLATLTPDEAVRLLHSWVVHGRHEQMTPRGDWRWWVVLAGRGFGKTRTGAEQVHLWAEQQPGCRIALVGRTYRDTRSVMVEGESGIVATSKPWNPCQWEPGKQTITWQNGSTAQCYTADKPDVLAGPQHHFAWGDEWCLWREVGGMHALDQMAMGLRLGTDPRAIITSTPRPTARVRAMLSRDDVHVTRGSTMDNRQNLAPGVVDELLRRYEGTRLGRQELHAEVLDAVEGALWDIDTIDAARVDTVPHTLPRVVVAIDPAVTALDESDETGIVVVGLGADGDAYVIEDLSGRHPVSDWTRIAVDAYHRHGASRIVAEVNQGGDLVESTIRAVHRRVAYEAVRASRGKATRAEPVSALYEQGRVHHVGMLPELEDQLCAWVPGLASPDRLDALVWGVTWLMPRIGRAPEVSWAAAPKIARPGF